MLHPIFLDHVSGVSSLLPQVEPEQRRFYDHTSGKTVWGAAVGKLLLPSRVLSVVGFISFAIYQSEQWKPCITSVVIRNANSLRYTTQNDARPPGD